jgi:mono/diheme cytochrome c family protein
MKSARPISVAERQLAEAGSMIYQVCAGCHQTNGEGLPNVAPSLVESPFVAGNPEMLVRIVLNGKEGTAGFPGAMPPIGSAFTDEQIAGILTFVRNSWGLQYGAVSEATVAKVRQQIGLRVNAWTNAELGLLEREMAKAAK